MALGQRGGHSRSHPPRSFRLAHALGFGTAWITEWYGYSPRVAAAMGLKPHERIAGFVYIGTAKERQPDRERPDLAKIVTRWTG